MGMRNARPADLYDFSGGINAKDPPHRMSETECWVSRESYDGTKNVYWDLGLKRRNGYTRVNSTAVHNGALNAHRAYRSSTPQQTTFVAVKDTGIGALIYYLDGSSLTQLAAASSEFGDDQIPKFATWKENIYVAGGDQPISKLSYSGSWSRADLSGLSYYPSVIGAHKERLFAAGGNMPEGYFEITKPGEDEKWASDGGEWFYAGREDGDPIQRIIGLKDDAIIYKYDSIWRLRGDGLENWFQEKDRPAIGCAAPLSLVELPFGHGFLASDRNFYVFDGITLYPLGEKIQPLLEQIPSGLVSLAAACYYEGWIRLSLPSSAAVSYNDIELWCDLRKFLVDRSAPWWLFSGRNIAAYVPYTGPEDDNEMYFVLADATYLCKESGGQDHQTDVECEFTGKQADFGLPNTNKAYGITKIDTGIGVGNLTVQMTRGPNADASFEKTLDTGAGTVTWGTAVLGVSTMTSRRLGRTRHEFKCPPRIDGQTLQIGAQYEGNHTDAILLYGLTLEVKEKAF